MGALRLQNECDVYAFKKKTKRLNKAQRRHLFLFDGGVLFCKRRSQALPFAPEYYEHKLCIPVNLIFILYLAQNAESFIEHRIKESTKT